MLISLATGKPGSWQLHRGKHPACISGDHPLSLQEKKKTLQSRIHSPRTIAKWASAGEAESVINCRRKRGWKTPMKAQRVERWEWETGLWERFSLVREKRILLVREPDLPNRPRTSCLNLTEWTSFPRETNEQNVAAGTDLSKTWFIHP